MSLQLVEPPKVGIIERLITMGRREPLALIATALAVFAVYVASGKDTGALKEAAQLFASEAMTVGTGGP